MAGSTGKKTSQRDRQVARVAPEQKRQPAPASAHADMMALQRAAGNRAVDRLLGAEAGLAPDDVLPPGGQPLEAETRAEMEAQFGQNLADVRVHTGTEAAASARMLGARAYTVGHDVVFGAGEYTPGTRAGRHLLAHELAHVIQTGPYSPSAQPLFGPQGDTWEADAARAGTAAEAGQPYHVAHGAPAALRMTPDPRLQEYLQRLRQIPLAFKTEVTVDKIFEQLQGLNLRDPDNLVPVAVLIQRTYPREVLELFAQRVSGQWQSQAGSEQPAVQLRQEESPGVVGTIAGGLMGEFNEDPTFAMIGTDMVVSLIPILDQISDARDIVAHIYFLGFKKQYNQPMRWVGLVFSLIGLFPELGTVIKSASKFIIKGAREAISHIDDIMRIVRQVMPSVEDASRLRRIISESWSAIVAFGTAKWEEVLERFAKLIGRTHFISKKWRELNAALEELRQLATTRLGEAWERVHSMIDEVLSHLSPRRAGEAGTKATRFADRLALKTISGITEAEQAVLSKLDEDSWTRILTYATSNRNVFSVKGKIAEELITHAPKFADAMQQAITRAEKMNIPAKAVQFVRDIRGLAPTAIGSGKFEELTDGAIVAIVGDRVHFLTVVESKSPHNLRELARKPGEFLGQIGWDFERLQTLPVMINGRIFQPSQIVISRHTTEWLGAVPAGLTHTKGQLEAIRQGFPGYQFFQGLVRNEILDAIAARLIGTLP
jgi:hypothetical protein